MNVCIHPSVRLSAADEAQATLAALLAAGHSLPAGATPFAENVLLDVFFDAPGQPVQMLSLDSGTLEEVCSERSGLQAALNGLDGPVLSAEKLIKDWEVLNKQLLPPEQRLVATIPFMLGGAYAAANLHAVPRSVALDYLLVIYRQTRPFKDGQSVKLNVTL